jgi:hypothetical protein
VDQHDEWIELFNPTDHTISLDGWVLDDLKDGGSKPWVIPAGTAMRPGEFLIFPGSETHLKLNDDGDEVWLIAPDGSWSQRVIIPKLKAGTSFSFCGGKLARRSPAPVFAELGLGEVGWRASDPTPGAPNACELSSESSSFSSMSSKRAKKSPPRPTAKSPFPTRYVLSLPEPVEASGTLMLTGSWVDLPPALATAGQPPSGTRAAEAGAVGGLSLLGVVLVTTRWRSLWGAGKLLLKL